MAWKIEFLPEAQKDLARLDKSVAQRILRFLNDRVKSLDNPREIGQALKGPELGKYWKYRVGDYRLLARILDKEILILIIHIGHRKRIYR
ncbi:MAG TPA: type II toxin-antitoxin system RelE/ParE family toxin [Acidobacteriota bacterium]